PADASLLQEFSNLAAGNRFAAQRHLVEDLHVETHLHAELLQGFHIPSGLVSEVEVVAFVNFASMQRIAQNTFGKLTRREKREIAAEGKYENRVQAGGREQVQFLRSRSQQFQAGVGTKNADRMRLEGNGNGLSALLPRPLDNVFQHCFVGAVNPIEVA